MSEVEATDSLRVMEFVLCQWNRNSRLKGFGISHLDICKYILEVQYCFHIVNYLAYLAGTKKVSAKCVFLYWDFISRILSAGIFLETEVFLSAGTCAESIICASCISGRKQGSGLQPSLQTHQRGLYFMPHKQTDVVLAVETCRLSVDKRVGHTAVCEECSQGFLLTVLFLYFHGITFRENLSLSLQFLYA